MAKGWGTGEGEGGVETPGNREKDKGHRDRFKEE